ncbi:ankyrin repeat protein [Medicago truncatula]|uniref:Ankyrin repeat protein n=1 Tax=Medicago truncatula TaxID=3880 RepID=A0A072UD46_MEDTR|nr:ankyrin repeat protein [Medicago truncatula]
MIHLRTAVSAKIALLYNFYTGFLLNSAQLLIAKGASLTAENANGWTPLMIACSWHRINNL